MWGKHAAAVWRLSRPPQRYLFGATVAAVTVMAATAATAALMPAAVTPVIAPAAPPAGPPAPVAQGVVCEAAAERPAWREVAAPGPGARALHAAAFDRARGLAVFFGGVRPDMAVLGDVWGFSPLTETWQEITVSGEAPTPRWAAAAVEDVPRGRVLVLFGNDGRPSEEVWALDLGRLVWERVASGPPARFDAAVASDGADRVWVYGGFPWSPAHPEAVLGDLWELDLAGNTWRQRTVAATQPPARLPPATTNASLAFHGDALYLAGGHTAVGATPGTWRYDLAAEICDVVSAPGRPAAWAHQARAMDEWCGRLLLAGGDNADERDVPYLEALQLGQPGQPNDPGQPRHLGHEPRYVRLPGEEAGVSRHHSAMALDPVSRRLILFGGWRGNGLFLGDTWLYQLW